MPSQRKRIGFLPRQEVQSIIDQICKHNKLSQSKVTGILVEEALKNRGMLNSSPDNKSTAMSKDFIKSLLISTDKINNKKANENYNFYLDKDNIDDEVQMINDFIEFKLFKNIINTSKKKFRK